MFAPKEAIAVRRWCCEVVPQEDLRLLPSMEGERRFCLTRRPQSSDQEAIINHVSTTNHPPFSGRHLYRTGVQASEASQGNGEAADAPGSGKTRQYPCPGITSQGDAQSP